MLKKNLYIKGIAIALATCTLFFLGSCEDDAIVTPVDSDSTDDCTGSYCKLEMNKSKEKEAIAIINDKTNPENF